MMNPKLIMFSAFGLGVIGAAVAVQGDFDGKFYYCQPSANGCIEKSIPDWVQVPENAVNLRRTPGASGWRLCGAFIAVGAFATSMSIARSLSSEEAKANKYQNIWETVNLHKLKLQAEAELEAFNQQAMIQAAELSYAVLEPYQQPLLKGETLEDVINPSTKLEASAEVQAVEKDISPDKFPWLKSFLSSTALAWGNQGSGKSWFVRLLALKKAQMGYRVMVFDPNSNATEWRGVELYNTYSAIEEQMRWYVREVMGRYEDFGQSTVTEEEWRSQLWKDGKAVAIIAEEATTYSDFIEDKELLAKFAKVSATLSRKQEMPVTFVAHNNTQSCLGDIKGLANLIARMQQIQLLATTDPETSQPVASGKALIRLDSSTEWVEVDTPKIENKIVNFAVAAKGDRTDKPSSNLDIQRELLNQAWQMPSVEPEPLNQPKQESSSSSNERFTPLKLTREQALKLIKQLRTELNQTELIESLWEVSKGGTVGWKKAYAEFKELMGGTDEQP